MKRNPHYHTAATAIGMGYEEYARNRDAGRLWCSGCRQWHPASEFGTDNSRATGKATACLVYRRISFRRYYRQNQAEIIEKVTERQRKEG